MDGQEGYALFFTLLAILIAIAVSVMVWQTRNEPRMKVRFPVVLWMEVFFSAIHSADVSLWYVGYFAPDRCQPAASIIEGMEWFIASLFIGRMSLIFMQAKVNNLIVNIPPIYDSIVDKIAFVTAPDYYYRFKDLHATAKALSSNIPAAELGESIQLKKKIPGYVRYLICASCWGAYGFISSYLYTTQIPSDPKSADREATTDCWLFYIRFQTAALFLLCAVICGFYVSIFIKVKDLVGTRNELVITLTIVGIAKLFNGFNIAILFFASSFYGDIISVFMYPFAVFMITFIYVYRLDSVIQSIFRGSHYQGSHTDNMSASLKSWKDIERIWNAGVDGKKFVTTIAQQLYMVEIIQFLEATDKITEGSLSATVFKNLFNNYVRENSKFQINISHSLRNRWEKVVKGTACDFSLLTSTRMEMFVLIWPGIARHVHRTLENKTQESGAGSSRKEGGSSHQKKPSHHRTTSGGGGDSIGDSTGLNDSGVGFSSPAGHVRKTSTGSLLGSPTSPASPSGGAPSAGGGAGTRKLADVIADQV